jgi:hypothetical protein
VVKRSFRAFRRDLLLYVTIAFLVVAISMGLGVLTAKRGEPPSPFLLNWLSLGGVMTIVYATAIHTYRAMWKSRRFWLGITLALLLEIGIGVLALWSAPRIAVPFWALLVFPANVVLVDRFLTRWSVASRGS